MSNEQKEYTPRLLAESTSTFHIDAPTADIDITDWLFNVDELEYINCTPVSAGSSVCELSPSRIL